MFFRVYCSMFSLWYLIELYISMTLIKKGGINLPVLCEFLIPIFRYYPVIHVVAFKRLCTV